jgi:hypothetical protein
MKINGVRLIELESEFVRDAETGGGVRVTKATLHISGMSDAAERELARMLERGCLSIEIRDVFESAL